MKRSVLIPVVLGATLLGAVDRAQANGRFPASVSVVTRPGNSQDIYVGLTFGMKLSHDDGWTWEWLCESNIGYGGMFAVLPVIALVGLLLHVLGARLQARAALVSAT